MPCLPAAAGPRDRCWCVLRACSWQGLGWQGHIFELVEPFGPLSILVDSEIPLGKLRITVLDCSFLQPVLEASIVMSVMKVIWTSL